MKTIRLGVFETNSSSTHSFCVAKEHTTNYPNFVKFELDEFGWECCKYSSTQDKANYLYTGICCQEDDLRKVLLERLKTILENNNIQYEFEEERAESYFYVDHSLDLNLDFFSILESEDQVLSFLFDEKSFILTGNDNDYEDVEIGFTGYEYYEYYKGN